MDKRFFLNYCTFGYTMAWWQWRDWERFIDWMALNGVNMPLAITGQEAIWLKVWKKSWA
ncbi:MAG: alpha-N-acetylglucosaminidase TIM-barrel domain-containing protein [Odoribacter sp.]